MEELGNLTIADNVGDLIENDFRQLFDEYTKMAPSFDIINEILTRMDIPVIKHLLLDDLFTSVLTTFGKIMQITFEVMEIKNNQQYMTKTTLEELFRLISTKNVHNIIHKGIQFTCGFHTESLFTHLHLAMCNAVSKQTTYEDKLYHGFIALVHDIGKWSTASTMYRKDSFKDKQLRNTTFYFHGEMGCGMLELMWNESFEQYFSKSDMEDISRTVCVHMCGYNEKEYERDQTKQKWDMLKIEKPEVKFNLKYLAEADKNAALTKDKVEFKLDSRFYEQICNTFTKKIEKILIIARGKSGSGKSSFSRNLSQWLTNKGVQNTIVERDSLMTIIVKNHVMRRDKLSMLPEMTYEECYNIYSEKGNNELKYNFKDNTAAYIK